jgi:PhnB protein
MNNDAFTQPYLFFDGKCEEALEFYKRAVGAKVTMLMHYKDAPPEAQQGIAPGIKNKVMHASLEIGKSHLMASDGHAKGNPNFDGFALSLSFSTEADVDKAFQALSEGGQVVAPAAKTFFSKRFGMVKDKFGVLWMVLTNPN